MNGNMESVMYGNDVESEENSKNSYCLFVCANFDLLLKKTDY
jgi:hypothetical protein